MDDPKSIDELIYDRRVPHSPAPAPPLPISASHCAVLWFASISMSTGFSLRSHRISSSASSHLDLEFLCATCAPFAGACSLERGGRGAAGVNHCYLDPLVAPSATLMLLLVFRIAIMLTIRRESPLWEITAMPPLLWGLIIRRSLLKNFLAD